MYPKASGSVQERSSKCHYVPRVELKFAPLARLPGKASCLQSSRFGACAFFKLCEQSAFTKGCPKLCDTFESIILMREHCFLLQVVKGWFRELIGAFKLDPGEK